MPYHDDDTSRGDETILVQSLIDVTVNDVRRRVRVLIVREILTKKKKKDLNFGHILVGDIRDFHK